LLLLMVAMLGVLAYGLASAATTLDISVPSWNERYFSPNGDKQEAPPRSPTALANRPTSPAP
jgi:hypothetical protein